MGTSQSADVPVFGFAVHPSVVLDKDDLPTRVLTAPGSSWMVGTVFRVRQNGSTWYVAPSRGRATLPWVQTDLASAHQLVGDTLYAIAKYVARLQRANTGDRPIVWVRTNGGHGELFYRSPSWGASVLSFALWQAGVPSFQPAGSPR